MMQTAAATIITAGLRMRLLSLALDQLLHKAAKGTLEVGYRAWQCL